jgi:hypothetical protein
MEGADPILKSRATHTHKVQQTLLQRFDANLITLLLV